VDSEAIQLFGQLRTPLLRYLRGLGLAVADGEDVVQDSFLALTHHLRRGKPRNNLPGWLFRVARNLALKKRLESAATVAWGAPAVDTGTADPEAHLVQAHRDRTIQNVLAALPALDRQCLTLRAEGLRYRQIAERLGISLGAVAQSLSRSLDKIARATDR